MSAKAIENSEGFAADALLQESQSYEDEPSQPSPAGSTPGGPPVDPPSGTPQEPDGPSTNSTDPPEDIKRNLGRTAATLAAAVAGGVLAVGSVPVLLGAVGFTSTGIAASSIAATLQSVGAAGLSTSSNILLGLTGSSLGAWWGSSKKKTSTQAGPDTEGKRGPDVGGDPQDDSPPNHKPPASQGGSGKDGK